MNYIKTGTIKSWTTVVLTVCSAFYMEKKFWLNLVTVRFVPGHTS